MRALVHRLGPNATRVVAVSSLLVVAVALIVIATGSGETYTMKARFDDVRGLIPGASVRAAAVNVGTVEKVDLAGSAPLVTMKIDADFPLHRGATADIQLFSNAGAVNRTIELTSGDPTAPKLPAGTVMQGPQTDQPVNFDDASETLDEPTRANIKRFLIGLDSALKGRGRDFDRTLRHSSAATNEVANLLAQVNSDGLALKTLVKQGSRVTSALAERPGDLAGAADRTAALLAVTGRRQAELADSVQQFGPALRRGRIALASLADATPRLRTLLDGLDPVATELRPFARVLPSTLRNAVPFLAETRKLVAAGPSDLRALRPIIASAHAVAPRLGSTIESILPLGNALRAYIPETVGFFQNLGSTIGSYDANGHMITLAAGLYQTPPSSATSTEVGPGGCTPGKLAKPYIRLPGALQCQPWANYADSAIGVEKAGR